MIHKRGGYCEIYISSKNKMAGTCKENGRGSDDKKDGGRKTVCRKKKRKTVYRKKKRKTVYRKKKRKTVYRKKKRKTSFEMDGRCGSRPESNEDRAVDGEDERQREMGTGC